MQDVGRIRLSEAKVDQQTFVFYNEKVLKKNLVSCNRNGEFETLLSQYVCCFDIFYYSLLVPPIYFFSSPLACTFLIC